MPRSIHIPFIPSSLRKLREIAGVTEEEAAKRVRKDVATIRKWESDKHEELPTIVQANDLSRLYNYDVFMCLDEIPSHIRPPEMPDFRTPERDGAPASDFSRQLRWLLRQLATRQEFVREYGPYWELKHQAWVGSVPIESAGADELAREMRGQLGIDVAIQREFGSVSTALKSWMTALANRAGVFVCQTSNQRGSAIELREMRGLSLVDPKAPFITLNSKDAEAGRIFTLFHELAHLWIGRGGLSGTVGLEARAARDHETPVEAFCDEVAANALMPKSEFDSIWKERDRGNTVATIHGLADAFRVSRDAVAVRAAKLGRISWWQYSEMRKDFRPTGNKAKAASGGGGNYYLTHLRNVGRKYAWLVMATWLDRQIGIKEAAYYLGIKPGQVYSFAEHTGFPA